MQPRIGRCSTLARITLVKINFTCISYVIMDFGECKVTPRGKNAILVKVHQLKRPSEQFSKYSKL